MVKKDKLIKEYGKVIYGVCQDSCRMNLKIGYSI